MTAATGVPSIFPAIPYGKVPCRTRFLGYGRRRARQEPRPYLSHRCFRYSDLMTPSTTANPEHQSLSRADTRAVDGMRDIKMPLFKRSSKVYFLHPACKSQVKQTGSHWAPEIGEKPGAHLPSCQPNECPGSNSSAQLHHCHCHCQSPSGCLPMQSSGWLTT